MTGNEFKKIREKFGLTQVQFARLIGTNNNTVSRWEQGNLEMRQTIGTLLKLLLRCADSEKLRTEIEKVRHKTSRK